MTNPVNVPSCPECGGRDIDLHQPLPEHAEGYCYTCIDFVRRVVWVGDSVPYSKTKMIVNVYESWPHFRAKGLPWRSYTVDYTDGHQKRVLQAQLEWAFKAGQVILVYPAPNNPPPSR